LEKNFREMSTEQKPGLRKGQEKQITNNPSYPHILGEKKMPQMPQRKGLKKNDRKRQKGKQTDESQKVNSKRGRGRRK